MTMSNARAVQEPPDDNFAIPDAVPFENPVEALDLMFEIVDAYPRLQGPHAGADEVLRRKLGHAFWRRRIIPALIEAISRSSSSQRADLLDALVALRTRIPLQLLEPLRLSVAPSAFAALLAAQGVRSKAAGAGDSAAGPQLDIKISANRRSSWSFEKWSKLDEFSNYDFEDEGVGYRGMSLRPGDVLLSNCNLDGNGIYTTLGDPKAYTSHAALFAILSARGRRFPVAIETFEKGVRPVPLNVFLSPRFAAYTEVYRHTGLTTEHMERVNRAALDLIREVKGYNFDTCDSDRDYVSCTGVPRFALQDAGLDPGTTKSYIGDYGIRRNLLTLGYDFFDFSSPVDFVLSHEYRCVGWFDNNQVDRLVARELIEVQFRQLFSQREINPERFPAAYRINRWGIKQMRKRAIFGRLISAIEGFDHLSLPKGPDALLALIKPAEQQIGRAIKTLHPTVQVHLEGLARLDLNQIRTNDRLQARIDTELQIPWLE